MTNFSVELTPKAEPQEQKEEWIIFIDEYVSRKGEASE